jgi:hypothetical protein
MSVIIHCTRFIWYNDVSGADCIQVKYWSLLLEILGFDSNLYHCQRKWKQYDVSIIISNHLNLSVCPLSSPLMIYSVIVTTLSRHSVAVSI